MKKGKTKLKTVQLSPNISSGDVETKLKQAIRFLSKKNQVKLVMFYKGRQNKYKEIGEETLLRFITELEDFGKPQYMPQHKGNRLVTILNPK